jgi:hypothetical protein
MWLVAIGSTLSAFWILVANGFMQHPVGYEVVNGHAQMVNFGALISNPRAIYLFLHTITSGLVTGTFFILGFSVYHLIRNQNTEAFQKSFKLAAIIGIVTTIAVVFTGDMQGRYLREVQPMAAAASEAQVTTSDPANFKIIAGFDSTGRNVIWSLEIPKGLSLLYYLKPAGVVEGYQNIQDQYQQQYSTQFGSVQYIPLVALDFWTSELWLAWGFNDINERNSIADRPEEISRQVGQAFCLVGGSYFPAIHCEYQRMDFDRDWQAALGSNRFDAYQGCGLAKLERFNCVDQPDRICTGLRRLMGVDVFLLLKNAKDGLAVSEIENAPAIMDDKKKGGE